MRVILLCGVSNSYVPFVAICQHSFGLCLIIMCVSSINKFFRSTSVHSLTFQSRYFSLGSIHTHSHTKHLPTDNTMPDRPILNKYSRVITQSKSQGASQAMLMATGLKWSDLNKAQVGICSVWYEGNPCNLHLLDLGKRVKKSIQSTNELIGFQFNTIGVSDGISMGTSGMSYSLPSRELIADSIETVVR